MADNPDGAHMRGLNANMIQTVDVSRNEHDSPNENCAELTDVEKQIGDAEQNVGLFRLIIQL